VKAVVGKGRRRLFEDGYEDITYKQVNNYVIQQFVLMTKWTEKYERQNQLYLRVVELWNMVRKSCWGQCPEKAKRSCCMDSLRSCYKKGKWGICV